MVTAGFIEQVGSIHMITKTGLDNSQKMDVYELVRESVDSLFRDGADAQYMQYLSKSRITSPQTC